MGTIHITTAGNDSTGAGTLGSPFRTIQKGYQVANPGDVIAVKPGWYNERGIVPSSSGSVGNRITLRGDYLGNIFGVPGPVVVDSSLSGDWNGNQFAESNNWDYHTIQGIVSLGSAAAFVPTPTTAGWLMNSFELLDCVVSAKTFPFIVYMGKANDSSKVLDLRRCVFVSLQTDQDATAPAVEIAFDSIIGAGASDMVYIENCYLEGYNGFLLGVASITHKAHILESTIVTRPTQVATSGRPIFHNGDVNCTTKLQRSVCVGKLPHDTGTLSHVDANWWYGPGMPGFYNALERYPFFPRMSYLGGWSDLIEVTATATSPTPGTDIFGSARPVGTYRDSGCQEYATGISPGLPTMKPGSAGGAVMPWIAPVWGRQ